MAWLFLGIKGIEVVRDAAVWVLIFPAALAGSALRAKITST